MGTMVCSYCVHTLPDKRLPHTSQRLLRAQAGFSHMLSKVVDVGLHVAELQSLYAGNPHTGADITHEIEDAGRISHTFSRDGIVGDGGKRDKDQPQAGSLEN